ncbi:hypothetical protein IQ258_18615 [Coleofasciculus sp. LEGE 07081]|nr:hypothetical protein [Coleofasciculus sp. LEGE 07081]
MRLNLALNHDSLLHFPSHLRRKRRSTPKLLAMGLSVEQIAQVLSLPAEVVRDAAQS